MQINRLELENFGVLRRLAHDFHPGVNGIIGSNGSGKSTVLLALGGALSGEFRADDRTKDSFVSQFAEPGAPASVALWFSHNGANVRVVRGLRKTTTELRIDGGAVVRGERDVTRELTALLGVEPQLLRSYVFPAQGELFAFIREQPAVRQKQFHRLFGLERATALWSLLGDELATTSQPAGADLAAAEAQLAATEAEHARLLAEAEADAQRLEYDPDCDAELAGMANYAAQLKVAAELTATQQELAAAVVAATAAAAEATQAEADLSQRVTELQAATSRRAATQAAALQWEAHQRYTAAAANLQRQQLRLQRKQAEAQQAQQAYAAQAPHALSAAQLAELRSARDQAVADLSWHEAFVTAFSGDQPTAACPTCHTPATRLQARLPDVVARRDELRAELVAHRAASVAAASAAAAHEAATVAAAAAADAAVEYDAAAAALGDDPAPDAVDVSAEAAAAQAAVQTAERERARAAARVAAALARRQQTAERQALLAGAEATLLSQRGAAMPQAEYLRLQALRQSRLAERDAARTRRGERQAVARQLQRDRQRLADARWSAAAAARAMAYRQHISEIRDLVRHDQLPRVLAQTALEALEQDINDRLVEFDAEFRVRTAEDLSFTVQFVDGVRVQPMSWLSFGQRILLALAVRITINSRYIGDIGFLALDEPTDSLDSENIKALHPALSRLKFLSQSRGMQCLIVTHEQQLRGLFDSLLCLPGTRDTAYAITS